MTENALDQLKVLTDKVAAAEKEVAENSKPLFTEAIKDIFAKHPALLYITWTQGTPSFNDGDPCRFSIHEICGRCNEWPKNEDGEALQQDEVSGYESWDHDNIDSDGTPELKTDFDKLANIISSLGEQICSVINEENATVFIDRTGIHADYYEMN